MTWAQARTVLAGWLETVEITSPVDQNQMVVVDRVFEYPPSDLEEAGLCFVIHPPAVTVRRASLLRFKTYIVRVRFLALDERRETAIAFADAFREAITDAIEDHLALDFAGGVGVVQVRGPTVEEGASFQYNDHDYLGFDALFTVEFTEGRTHNP